MLKNEMEDCSRQIQWAFANKLTMVDRKTTKSETETEKTNNLLFKFLSEIDEDYANDYWSK